MPTARRATRQREAPVQSDQMNLPAPLEHSIYFGPPASHPLNGDLNFRINTFLTDPSGGWRTLQASIETLLVRCGTQLWNIYIHFGSWQCQSESKMATWAHEPTCNLERHWGWEDSRRLFLPLKYQMCCLILLVLCVSVWLRKLSFLELDSWEEKLFRS